MGVGGVMALLLLACLDDGGLLAVMVLLIHLMGVGRMKEARNAWQ